MMHLYITTSPASDDISAIRLGLSHYNLAQVPELLALPDEDYLVVMRENGKIVAGTVCEIDWGWLFFDVVWTDEAVRGKGYGTLIMNAAETYAVHQGVNSAYLMTTSFQARPFYEKLGYTCYSEQVDRPKGHVFNYMRKTQLQMHPLDPRISIEAPPQNSSLDILDNGLLGEIAKTAPLNNYPVAIFLQDDNDVILGGLVASVFWDWMDIRLLWVDHALKGQGWGKKLLQTAEVEAKQHNCLGITCDTTSFQALTFYQSQGFKIIGTLEDRPPKHTSYFIEKRF